MKRAWGVFKQMRVTSPKNLENLIVALIFEMRLSKYITFNWLEKEVKSAGHQCSTCYLLINHLWYKGLKALKPKQRPAKAFWFFWVIYIWLVKTSESMSIQQDRKAIINLLLRKCITYFRKRFRQVLYLNSNDFRIWFAFLCHGPGWNQIKNCLRIFVPIPRNSMLCQLTSKHWIFAEPF